MSLKKKISHLTVQSAEEPDSNAFEDGNNHNKNEKQAVFRNADVEKGVAKKRRHQMDGDSQLRKGLLMMKRQNYQYNEL